MIVNDTWAGWDRLDELDDAEERTENGIVRVRDVMSGPAAEIESDCTLREVAAQLVEQQVGALVVPDHHGSVAMVSERDVVRALAQGVDPDEARAADVMTDDPAFVTPEDVLEDVIAAMAGNWVRHLPVVDENGAVRGVVSARDVLLALSD